MGRGCQVSFLTYLQPQISERSVSYDTRSPKKNGSLALLACVAGQVVEQKKKHFSQSMGDPHDLSPTFKCEVKYISLDRYGLINTSPSPYKPTP